MAGAEGADEARWVVKEPAARAEKASPSMYTDGAARPALLARSAGSGKTGLALARCAEKILEIILAHTRCAQRAGAGRVVSCEESGGYGA